VGRGHPAVDSLPGCRGALLGSCNHPKEIVQDCYIVHAKELLLMRGVKPQDLADWLLARGRHWVTTAEIGSLLGVPVAHSVAARLGWVLERHGDVSGLDVLRARASAPAAGSWPAPGCSKWTLTACSRVVALVDVWRWRTGRRSKPANVQFDNPVSQVWVPDNVQ
jgi:hypothetical protein